MRPDLRRQELEGARQAASLVLGLIHGLVVTMTGLAEEYLPLRPPRTSKAT
jgi:hypothetical protein